MRLTRAAFLVTGLGFLCFAGIGLIVPGWPTTIFCILSLYCFKRSSSRLENWLLNHKLIGQTLRDWDENRWMSLRAKVIAISVMWVSMLISAFFIKNHLVAGIIGLCGVLVTIFIATRRTKPANIISP